MQIINEIKQCIINNKFGNFNELALELFNFQSRHCEVYRRYLEYLNIDPEKIGSINSIPCLPISFFKHHKITSFPELEIQKVFESSGTTESIKSKHYIYDLELYKKNALNGFNNFYGSVEDYHILALLPSYLEQKNSSLIFMMDHLIKLSRSEEGSYLNNYDKLIERLSDLMKGKSKIILIGVSFALLELAEKFTPDLSKLVIMETGGMKGRRKEITRKELHEILMNSFNTDSIHSEYGMCELLSQSYSKGDGIFKPNNSKQVIIKEINDPFKEVETEKTGKINIIDLANMYTCAFIETNDIGKKYSNNSFEILGRTDGSDLRGCNLMFS